MRAQVDTPGLVRQGASVDHLRPGLGQWALVEFWEFFVKLSGKNQAEDGITQEFQTLIGFYGGPHFMPDRWMCQGKSQQGRISKGVAEINLELFKICHGI